LPTEQLDQPSGADIDLDAIRLKSTRRTSAISIARVWSGAAAGKPHERAHLALPSAGI
jgi:hypothetical protein